MFTFPWVKVIVCPVAPVIKKDWVTEVAAYQELSPACEAVMMQVPPATSVTVAVVVLPESVPVATVQTAVSTEVNVMSRLEVVLAVIVRVLADLCTSVGFAKVMVCGWPIVNDTCTSVAGEYADCVPAAPFVVPSWDATKIHTPAAVLFRVVELTPLEIVGET